MAKLTAAQARNLEILRSAGGVLVSRRFEWFAPGSRVAVRGLSGTALKSLRRAGLVVALDADGAPLDPGAVVLPAQIRLADQGSLADPSSLHAELDRNVDSYYDGRITHEEFDRRQREVWGRIRQAGAESQVLERIRGELPPPGHPAVEPRHGAPSRSQVERDVRALRSRD